VTVSGKNAGTILLSALSKLSKTLHILLARKVRLLLITGDEAAIEQLVPGLQNSSGLKATVPF
jgi:type VI secretion system protein ImpL